MLTIQHLPSPSPTNNVLSMEDLYPTLDYIDDQTTSTLPRFLRYSTRHRNVNRQFSMNIPLVRSHSELTLSSHRRDEEHFDMKMLKISVPVLNHYPRMTSSYSNISFDSQLELEQFHQMTNLSLENDVFIVS